MNFDQFKILTSDVVKVLLHFSEGGLVVHHQFVDVLVFALLDLVDFYLHAQFQFSLELREFSFVVLNQTLLLGFKIGL